MDGSVQEPVIFEHEVRRLHDEDRASVDAVLPGHAGDLDLEDEAGVDLHGDLAGKLVLEEVDVRVDRIPDLLDEASIVDDRQAADRDALHLRHRRGGGLDDGHGLVDLRGAGGDGGDGVGVDVAAGGKGQGEGEGGGQGVTHRNPPVMRSHDVLYYSISAASTIE